LTPDNGCPAAAAALFFVSRSRIRRPQPGDQRFGDPPVYHESADHERQEDHPGCVGRTWLRRVIACTAPPRESPRRPASESKRSDRSAGPSAPVVDAGGVVDGEVQSGSCPTQRHSPTPRGDTAGWMSRPGVEPGEYDGIEPRYGALPTGRGIHASSRQAADVRDAG
jgi:hypothetical protein